MDQLGVRGLGHVFLNCKNGKGDFNLSECCVKIFASLFDGVG